jgi:hypothetical protein
VLVTELLSDREVNFVKEIDRLIACVFETLAQFTNSRPSIEMLSGEEVLTSGSKVTGDEEIIRMFDGVRITGSVCVVYVVTGYVEQTGVGLQISPRSGPQGK